MELKTPTVQLKLMFEGEVRKFFFSAVDALHMHSHKHTASETSELISQIETLNS